MITENSDASSPPLGDPDWYDTAYTYRVPIQITKTDEDLSDVPISGMTVWKFRWAMSI